MNKSLYYIECTCIKNCIYPNIEFHEGDIFYYNKKARANEMYLWNYKDSNRNISEEAIKYRGIGDWSYLPFTRQKKFAKKWQIKEYAENISRLIESRGEFTCSIKEIKITYTEEEI